MVGEGDRPLEGKLLRQVVVGVMHILETGLALVLELPR
jgi:hypothetical protein